MDCFVVKKHSLLLPFRHLFVSSFCVLACEISFSGDLDPARKKSIEFQTLNKYFFFTHAGTLTQGEEECQHRIFYSSAVKHARKLGEAFFCLHPVKHGYKQTNWKHWSRSFRLLLALWLSTLVLACPFSAYMFTQANTKHIRRSFKGKICIAGRQLEKIKCTQILC